MHIVAKVINYEITERDLERECAKYRDMDQKRITLQALNRLIDRHLLLAKAIQAGVEISEEEYDNALLELIEEEEPLGLNSESIQELTAKELETLLRRQLIIKKYVSTLCTDHLPITSEKLSELYEEKKDIFSKPEKIHCLHILVKGKGRDAHAKALEIRAKIHNLAEFSNFITNYPAYLSDATYDDLGWFHKGRMIAEIDAIAFALKVGEISQPFPSVYGYHIVMLIEHKDQEEIPFEKIRDSLYARLQQLEKEFLLSQHVAELRRQYASDIIIFSPLQNQA